jgi:phospholipid/cholesterol/gamma-HCH transport system ATP-binding protein
VLVDGVSVSRADGRTIKRIRSRISYVFQNSALFDSLTVEGNILLGLPEGHCKRPDVDCHELVREALEHVNLGPGVLPLLPAELSGGMQKRVALARAVVGRQPYILYDEPTTGLDPLNASNINQLIARLKSEIGSTSVIVTHDVDSAFFLADRIAVLSDGVIQAVGTPEELRTTPNPRVQRFLDPAAYAGAM